MVRDLEGRVLDGRWTLGPCLGHGRSGQLHVATHRNGTRATVRILDAGAADPLALASFLREGYVANRVGHPGVVLALDDDRTDDGLVYLVLEHVEGRTLEAVLAGGDPIPLLDALAHVDAVLDVLVAAHGVGVVHGALSPAHVLLTPEGRVKVTGFGAVATVSPEADVVAAVALLEAMLAGARVPRSVARVLARVRGSEPGAPFTNARRLRGALRFARGEVEALLRDEGAPAPASSPPAPGRTPREVLGRTSFAAYALVAAVLVGLLVLGLGSRLVARPAAAPSPAKAER